MTNNDEVNIDMHALPRHIAFIMDGNGRWAKKKGYPRIFGHNAGTEVLKRIVKESKSIGIEYVTFYAFSTENWKRPSDEVEGLMKILVRFIKSEIKEIHENNIKINVLGDIQKLPDYARRAVVGALEKTKLNSGMQFNIAINYGGRDEIIRAVKHIATEVRDLGLDIEKIDDACFQKHLYTRDMPDPDLMIRTSGEMRLSNYLLWQLAYTEFIFETVEWPDFTEEKYRQAIYTYQERNRRYGGI